MLPVGGGCCCGCCCGGSEDAELGWLPSLPSEGEVVDVEAVEWEAGGLAGSGWRHMRS